MKGKDMIRKDEIERDINYLEDSLKKVRRELDSLKKKVPEGAKLRAVKHKNQYQYFMKLKGYGQNGKYISADDKKTAEILAQIEYDEKLIDILNKYIHSYKKLEEAGLYNPFELALNHMTCGKRDLVNEHYVSDEKYVINWRNQEYDRMGFKEGFPEYYTRQGLRVRSKSEVIIADILDEYAVPFLYEKPLKLGTLTVHPDFTLLNMDNKKELYWEHFGMMDDIEYRNNAFIKIQRYEQNGFYQHSSLIWTFETISLPLSTRVIRKMIEELKNSLGY